MNGPYDEEGRNNGIPEDGFETVPLFTPPTSPQQEKREMAALAMIDSDSERSRVPYSQSEPILVPTKPIQIASITQQGQSAKQHVSPSSIVSELTLLIKPEYLGVLHTLSPHSPLTIMQSAELSSAEYLRKRACFTIGQLASFDGALQGTIADSLRKMHKDAKILAQLLPWKRSNPPAKVQNYWAERAAKLLDEVYSLDDISVHSSLSVMKGMSKIHENILFSCRVSTLMTLARLGENRHDFQALKSRLSKPVLKRYMRRAEKLVTYLNEYNQSKKSTATLGNLSSNHTRGNEKRFLGQKLESIPGEAFMNQKGKQQHQQQQHQQQQSYYQEEQEPMQFQTNRGYVEPVQGAAEPVPPLLEAPTERQNNAAQLSKFTFIDDPTLELLIKEEIPKESITSDSPISVIKGVDEDVVKHLRSHTPPITTIRQLAGLHAEDEVFYEECTKLMPIDEIVIKAETLCCVLDEDYYMPDLMPDLIPPDQGSDRTPTPVGSPEQDPFTLLDELANMDTGSLLNRTYDREGKGKEKEKEREKT